MKRLFFISISIALIAQLWGCDGKTGHKDASATDNAGTDSNSAATDTDNSDSGSDWDSDGVIDVCNPSETRTCDCDADAIGAAHCRPDGRGWDDCECTSYGLNLFVRPGESGGDGGVDAPFGSLTEARDAVRALKQADQLPNNGVAIWLREGTYTIRETLQLNNADSGTADAIVAWRAYPGETVRVTGGATVSSDDFSLVTSDDPVWNRLDGSVHGAVYKVDLSALGISDFGDLGRRGFCGERNTSALELFFNGTPMTLARWPDVDEGIDPIDPAGDTITVYGNLTPDVSGDYTRIGDNDDVSVFKKDDLVDGLQYYLYRNHWQYQDSWHQAWFLTTNQSGYPADTDPWWSSYTTAPGPMNPSNGAVGTPTFIPANALQHGMAFIDKSLSDTQWTYADDHIDNWANSDAVWFHGWWEHAWADCRVGAAAIDATTNTVTLNDDTGYGIKAGQPFYAFNILEEITAPGEWFLDRATGNLYFYPPTDLTDADISVSVFDDLLLSITNAEYIEVRDIIFEESRSQLVRVDEGNHVVLDGVTLRNGGASGISISGSNNGIRNCVIHHTATGGATVSGGERRSLTGANNFVENCHIHHFGRTEWTYRPGVRLNGVGNRATNNLIHSAPHAAILYGGNEHDISKNHIHNVCEYSSDAGAIYAGRDWGARGNVIQHNFIHHIYTKLDGYGVHGIYLDDCLSGVTVFGNILTNIENHAILHGGGRDNLMDNNIMVNCGDAISADSRCFDWRPDGGPNNTPGNSWNLLEKLQNVGYQDDPWATSYPACAAIPNDWDAIIAPDATWLYPEGCTFNRNIGYNNADWMRGGTSFDHYAAIEDNVENADPRFTDPANLDMSLQPDSPALQIPGFVPIPFDEIGIQ